MPLCSHRPSIPGSPSTCTLDTAIIPIPSFCFIAAFFLLHLRFIKAKANVGSPTYPKWLHYIYFVLVIAALGMALLEIARLVVADLGVGLLPITPVALVLAIVILWHERRARTRTMSYLLSGYWLFILVVEIVKTVRLHVLEQQEVGKQAYPASDMWLDNVVLTALYALFLCTELVELALSRGPAGEPFELRGVRS